MKRTLYQKNSQHQLWIRAVAIGLSFCYILTSADAKLLAQRAPRTPVSAEMQATFNPFEKLAALEDFGTIDEIYVSPSNKQKNLILYIQDAHDSLEAQKSIAQIIRYLVDKQYTETVFQEGYEGRLPTDEYFNFLEEKEFKRKVTYKLMDQLLIGGAEFAHINRSKDFTLLGAENAQLHLNNIEAYRKAFKVRNEVTSDLDALNAELTQLIQVRFPKNLKEWIKIKKRYDTQLLDFLNYLRRTQEIFLAKSERSAFQSQHPSLAIILAEAESVGLQAQEKIKSLETKKIVEETHLLEEKIAELFLLNPTNKKIWQQYKLVQLLYKLNDISLSSEEYRLLRNALQGFDTESVARFIASESKKSVVLSKNWEKNITFSIQFYETARMRDLEFEKILNKNLKKKREKIDVIVFGGFHKNAIREILREQDRSYMVITPKILKLEERHRSYYQKLMLEGIEGLGFGELIREATIHQRLYTYMTPTEARAYMAQRMPKLFEMSKSLTLSETRTADPREMVSENKKGKYDRRIIEAVLYYVPIALQGFEQITGRELSEADVRSFLAVSVIDANFLNRYYGLENRKKPRKKKDTRNKNSVSFNDEQADIIAKIVFASKEKYKPWYRKHWRILLATSFSVFLFTAIFFAWVNSFLKGQYFDSFDTGTDFYRYSQGSLALFELGIDPYSNEAMREAIQAGHLPVNHPNFNHETQMVMGSFKDLGTPMPKGVVSPPFILVLFYPFVKALGYHLALNIFIAGSFFAYIWTSLLFWKKLGPTEKEGGSFWKKVVSRFNMFVLFVGTSTAVLVSMTYGQFDALYLVPFAFGIYRWVFHRDKTATPIIAGGLIAFAGAIKIFPLFILGYFAVKSFFQWKNFEKRKLFSRETYRKLWQESPEFKILIYGVVFFVAINFLTMMMAGTSIYGSFFTKLGMLSGEATSSYVKGNLYSYLKFLPIWLSDPFNAMTGVLGYFFLPIVMIIFWKMVKPFIVNEPVVNPRGEKERDNEKVRRVLEVSLLITFLPTVLPHWWVYYNVVMIVPMIAIYSYAQNIDSQRTRRIVKGFLATSIIFSFSSFTGGFLAKIFPATYEYFTNQDAVNAAMIKARKNLNLLENLPYSQGGELSVSEIKGRVPSLWNFFHGYFGTVLIFVAAWLTLKTYRVRNNKSRALDTEFIPIETEVLEVHNQTKPTRRDVVVGTFLFSTFSSLGGTSLAILGMRRLLRTPYVNEIQDHPKNSNRKEVRDLIKSVLRTTNLAAQSKTHSQSVAVVIYDSPPLSDFVNYLKKKQPTLARRLDRDPLLYKQKGSVKDQVKSLYGEYQEDFNKRYGAWNRGERERASHDYSEEVGYFLEELESQGKALGFDFIRVAESWQEWEARFFIEGIWNQMINELTDFQISLEEGIISEEDVRDMTLFSRLAKARQFAVKKYHHIRQSRLKTLLKDKDLQNELAQYGANLYFATSHPLFVLPFFEQFINAPDDPLSLVRLGVAFTLEDLVYRARKHKTGDPNEALKYTKKFTTSFLLNEKKKGSGSWHAGFYRQHKDKKVGTKEILQSLIEEGWLKVEDVEIRDYLLFPARRRVRNPAVFEPPPVRPRSETRLVQEGLTAMNPSEKLPNMLRNPTMRHAFIVDANTYEAMSLEQRMAILKKGNHPSYKIVFHLSSETRSQIDQELIQHARDFTNVQILVNQPIVRLPGYNLIYIVRDDVVGYSEFRYTAKASENNRYYIVRYKEGEQKPGVAMIAVYLIESMRDQEVKKDPYLEKWFSRLISGLSSYFSSIVYVSRSA